MQEKGKFNALILGVSIFLGLSSLGYLLAQAAITYKNTNVLSPKVCQNSSMRVYGRCGDLAD